MESPLKSTRPPKRALKIALGHQARVGKDTFADVVTKHLTAAQFAFADELKLLCADVQRSLGRPIVKDPMLLQLLGEGLRHVYGSYVWITPTMRNIEEVIAELPECSIVVTDLRYLDEALTLRAAGFTLIKIDRPDHPIDRDPTHPSEVGLVEGDFDYVVYNSGDMVQYVRMVEDLLAHLIGETFAQ